MKYLRPTWLEYNERGRVTEASSYTACGQVQRILNERVEEVKGGDFWQAEDVSTERGIACSGTGVIAVNGVKDEEGSIRGKVG